MRPSCCVIASRSASLSSSRASLATQRTCSAGRDTFSPRMASDAGRLQSQVGRHLEGRASLRTLDLAAADTCHADAQFLDRAADLALDRLQVRLEGPATDASDLAADAAQVLCLAAPRVVVA